MNETLTFEALLAPPLLAFSPRLASTVTVMMRKHQDESVCAGTRFSSMPRPRLTAVCFVIVDFRRCRGFAKGERPEGVIFLRAALY